jgi:hypothetical protein
MRATTRNTVTMPWLLPSHETDSVVSPARFAMRRRRTEETISNVFSLLGRILMTPMELPARRC